MQHAARQHEQMPDSVHKFRPFRFIKNDADRIAQTAGDKITKSGRRNKR